MKLTQQDRVTIRKLTGSETLAKALFLTARAKRGAKAPEGRGPFSRTKEWPPLETPAQADWHWRGFVDQGDDGREIIDNWQHEGDVLIEAILAIDTAPPPDKE